MSPGPSPVAFRARLRDAVAAHGPLCVGIDPHPGLLAGWGLDADATGVERFARGVVEALDDFYCQRRIEFFEQHPQSRAHNARADQHDVGVLTPCILVSHSFK